ncbi:MAG: FAD/NAD(P)-binding protein [Planctomycetes bacterium]|nr:FAD/NAD(P)-binding protein [Planctomycetota bacterium]
MLSETKIDKNLYAPQIGTLSRVCNLTEKEKLFEVKLNNGKELGHQPGQFVEVSVFGIGEAPISISSSPTKKGSFELGIRAVGNVTNAIHKLKEGDTVGIRGPFGNGFPVDELKGRDILFVAAGIGYFPLRSLMNYVLDKRDSFGEVTVFCGTKRACDRLMPDECNQLSCRSDVRFHETVDVGDDSWKGNVGLITTLFQKNIKFNPAKTTAIIVGPPVMYKFAIAAAQKVGIPDKEIILSLERKMKCGVAKCGHCQMNNIYVCKEGPVFRYNEIKNIREAL